MYNFARILIRRNNINDIKPAVQTQGRDYNASICCGVWNEISNLTKAKSVSISLLSTLLLGFKLLPKVKLNLSTDFLLLPRTYCLKCKHETPLTKPKLEYLFLYKVNVFSPDQS